MNSANTIATTNASKYSRRTERRPGAACGGGTGGRGDDSGGSMRRGL